MHDYLQLSRRQFLRGTLSLSLGLWATCSTDASAHADVDDNVLDQLRANLLQLVNDERDVEKVPRVAMDRLATEVATNHAKDMAKHGYASHWNREGLKPYHRYSVAGGFHATQENVSAADNTWSLQPRSLIQDTSYLHVRLYSEKPPYDGHRQAILSSYQTHVGFGIAIDELRLRVVELFVTKYVDLNVPREKFKPGDTFSLTGRLLNPDHILMLVEVFYEPLPKELELSWLRTPRSYSLPDESVELRPKLPPQFTYSDSRLGVVELDPTGSFRAPINLFKSQPGIYTLVCWVKLSRTAKAFPATALCVHAE
jgi:uncharacterized protein YkwD